MAGERSSGILVGILAFLGLCAAFFFAEALLAPVAFALFIIAVVRPVQVAFSRRIPALPAALLTVLITLAVVASVLSTVVWGLGHVGQWVFGNVARFQALYENVTTFLEGHGFVMASLLADHFDVRWLLRLIQEISGRLNTLGSFLVITFVYVLLGLLEVDVLRRQVGRLPRRETADFLLAAGGDVARKLQTYMLVRTLMSVATGFVVWGFTLAAGLELATAWGAIAFAMNYIPFIGPFIATFLPTVFAVVQSGSWELAVLVFVSLNVIQFLTGSYLEPRIAGRALAVSPFMVLFAVFFFSFLWGLEGAFIGVPILIATLTVCARSTSARWVADLLSGRDPPETPAAET
ncbi:AI-2E family transporter [Aquabacter cavernae]|uniref:AI-2E family transporter n=1 Tax=Aquabacter cavernae TaxID=2496029 RepID=UPI000F8E6FA2|nr:AI-2E family transporter [Aquabacter cavernae]